MRQISNLKDSLFQLLKLKQAGGSLKESTFTSSESQSELTFSEFHSSNLLNILELKAHRRKIYNDLNAQRLANESLRSEVDQAHLKYQCLVYEIN